MHLVLCYTYIIEGNPLLIQPWLSTSNQTKLIGIYGRLSAANLSIKLDHVFISAPFLNGFEQTNVGNKIAYSI